jgi:hypothetical protein
MYLWCLGLVYYCFLKKINKILKALGIEFDYQKQKTER